MAGAMVLLVSALPRSAYGGTGPAPRYTERGSQDTPQTLPERRQDRQFNFSDADEHERWLAKIDYAALAVQQTGGSYLLAIARLGKGERNRRLNRTRLKYVGEILRSRGVTFRFVTAEGDSVHELGRIEFYVCNELFDVLTYRRNQAAAIQHRP
jgi:hypothetical protein